MTVASVSAPGEDKLKFEVSNKLGKAFPSFFLKGLREFVLLCIRESYADQYQIFIYQTLSK